MGLRLMILLHNYLSYYTDWHCTPTYGRGGRRTQGTARHSCATSSANHKYLRYIEELDLRGLAASPLQQLLPIVRAFRREFAIASRGLRDRGYIYKRRGRRCLRWRHVLLANFFRWLHRLLTSSNLCNLKNLRCFLFFLLLIFSKLFLHTFQFVLISW